ncbi:MAG: glycerophosphodiester phosphodiesterase family protein [Elusimicrobiota bacterium]
MLIIGHRGSSFIAPENTLASINLAWKQGADAVEIDIRLTKDGRVVASHDASALRMAGVDLTIATSTFAELRALDFGKVKDEKYKGETIPSLEEIIDTIPAGKVLVVEIKAGLEILNEYCRIVNSSSKKAQVLSIGFGYETMVECKKMMPDNIALYLVSTKKDKDTGIYAPYDIDAVIAKTVEGKLDGLDVHYVPVNSEFVDKTLDANLQLYVWTVNEVVEAQRLDSIGVDGLTTDKPDVMLRNLNRR